MMTVEELLNAHGIKLESTVPGQHYTTCPQCSAKRSTAHQKTKCLGVKIDGKGVCWRCNHCGWTGPDKGIGKGRGGDGKWKTLAEFIYRDKDDKPFLKVKKCLDADGARQFPQYHWDGIAWVKGKPKAPKIPYRLRDLLAASTTTLIYHVEGEKDAETLAKLGFVATTASEGARAKWDPALTPYFKDRHVVILPDADEPGRQHAQKVAKAINSVAASVRVLELYPDRHDGSDVSDWIKGEDTAGAKLAKLAKEAPLWEPPTEPTPTDIEVEITRLAKLSLGEYEQQRRDAAKKLRFRAETLDDMVAAERTRLGLSGGQGQTTADLLVGLSTRAKELFYAPDGTAFAIIPVGNHLETWPVRSKGFKRWLVREFYGETSSAPNSDAIQAALNVIEARAHFDGRQRPVYIRVGIFEGRLYLDLADAQWRCVEISEDDWKIIDEPPIPFRRAAGMLPLPEPVHGGSINELRPFLNIADDKDGDVNKDFVLAVSWELAALRDRGPYPVLALAGEHGSAKSTLTKVLRGLIDPNSAPLRALPREDRDLFIAANNAWVLAFDNVSKLYDWISDTLCRLATGGGFATRQLYSDQDEALFDATRPIILNGIEDIVERPDLADRSIFVKLENIAEDKRKPELAFWAEFERAHPRILGALLDGVVHGLRQLPDVRLDRTPRMADFAVWATACETAFWDTGAFATAYGENLDEAVATVIEADLVAAAVQTFMAARTQWSGTSSDLLGALKILVGEAQTKLKEWPPTPRSLSGKLRRAAATLRGVGIEITFVREGHARARTITLSQIEEGKDRPHRPHRPQSQDFNGFAAHANADGRDGADANGDDAAGTVRATVRANPLKNNAADGADGADAKFPIQTGRADEPGLSRQRIGEIGGWYKDETHRRYNEDTLDVAELDAELRAILREEVDLPEHIEIEFKRVMDAVFAGV